MQPGGELLVAVLGDAAPGQPGLSSLGNVNSFPRCRARAPGGRAFASRLEGVQAGSLPPSLPGGPVPIGPLTREHCARCKVWVLWKVR